MKTKFGISIILSILFLGSCCTHFSSKKNMKIILEPTIEQDFKPETTDLSYTIKNATLENTLLTIDLSYIGGCGEHNFNLIFNGMYKKSLPLQADLFLIHKNIGDTCTQEKNQRLQYNLSSIIGNRKQSINFTLTGYPQKLKYSINQK